jgi:uncharacterized protein DUF1259
MNHKKPLLLLLVGPTLLCSVALVASINPAAIAQQQNNTGGNQNMTAATTTTTNNTGTSTAGTLDCQMAASGLGGIVIPNPTGVCDVAVPRQGLQVQDTATGATLNNLLVINPLFEFTQLSNQGTTGAANQTMVYGFAEFALMEGELPSAMRMLSNSSWNVIAVHNHVIGESPSMIFAHAVANGDINTLVRDARTVLDALMTQTLSQSSNQTSTTAGGGDGGNATTTAGSTTGDTMNSSPSADSLTGGTTTGEGATAGSGVGTFGGGSGTGPGPGIGTTEGGGQQQGGEGGGGTTTDGGDSGGDGTTGGAAGPQVRP